MNSQAAFSNPFRPGAGHRPPYLAGRQHEKQEFSRLLAQTVVTDNFVITGLRGVGKTVLLEELKPAALSEGWLWVGTDMSESATISEANIAQRLITDLSVVTSSVKVAEEKNSAIGFIGRDQSVDVNLTYDVLIGIYNATPGLVVDKLKALFNVIAPCVSAMGRKGVVFAYDEAQNLADHAQKEQYPLSVLLDLFQSVQRQGIPFLLVFSGLPTLFPKLIEARTYAERMFRVIFLEKLSESETREAIEKPVQETGCPVTFNKSAVAMIYKYSGGYPYFIQFICRESYDAYLQQAADGKPPVVPITGIIRKLDTDFFAGRWSRATDRQQELLSVIASLPNRDSEFTVQEILAKSEEILKKPFGRSHINQLLTSLISAGLIYRDRHGKYLFAVPLMADFIKRTMESGT
jgi:type II secretory pathway predicted ATPase ExeA